MNKTMHGLLYVTKPLDIKNLTVGDLVDELHKDINNCIRVNNVKNFHINKNKVTIEI